MSTRRYIAPLQPGPDGQMVANIGRYHREAVSTVFQMNGGTEWMADWARRNPTEFFTRLYPRLIPKEVEHGTTEGVEDLIRRLDAGEHAPVIDGKVTEVPYTEDYESNADKR